ncbi:hypothetical protein GCM10022291_28700 [Postechiella marina]|uniref:Peptidase E n=1 Tax=Postechiella marina TaxID=943941 RepID=A0ABP8CFF9_9FLAO
MRNPKILLLFFIAPLLAFTAMHKYYISVTQVEYIPEKKSVQVITRIFIDDLERLIQERYDETIVLAEDAESSDVNLYIERYLREKIKIKINNNDLNFAFIGKEYDLDIVRCYIEVEQINNIKSIEVVNKVLFDLYPEQQNIIKLKVNSKQKSFILTQQKDAAMLIFD